MPMSDVRLPKLAGPVRGRPFEKGQSGNPAGRRVGCRNKTTIAAAALLTGEAEALTRRAVELALVGDPWTFSSRACPLGAMPPCLERILPPCRDRMVKFVLPPMESAADPSSSLGAGIAGAMKAVTSAPAGGVISPGEATTIAAVVDTFMPEIETSDFERRLQLVEAERSNHSGAATGMKDAGPGQHYNP
jgi:hypothetical protein